MKKIDKISILNEALKKELVCNIIFNYDAVYFNLLPLSISDKFVLSAEEDDFIIDGFCIRKISDIKKIRQKENIIAKILKNEVEIPKAPNVNIESWYNVFSDLFKIGKNVIIEIESLNDKECEFNIGKIISVGKNYVLFRHFDAEGIWEEDSFRIFFSEITSVTFESRYVSIFSKYIDDILE